MATASNDWSTKELLLLLQQLPCKRFAEHVSAGCQLQLNRPVTTPGTVSCSCRSSSALAACCPPKEEVAWLAWLFVTAMKPVDSFQCTVVAMYFHDHVTLTQSDLLHVAVLMIAMPVQQVWRIIHQAGAAVLLLL